MITRYFNTSVKFFKFDNAKEYLVHLSQFMIEHDIIINPHVHIFLNKIVSLNVKIIIYWKPLTHYLFIGKFLNIFRVMQLLQYAI